MNEELYRLTFKEWSFTIHSNSVLKGFWDSVDKNSNKDIALMVSLIASECFEAINELRNNCEDNPINNENFKEEIADIIIRCFDLCGALNMDIENEIIKKHMNNRERKHLHGKNF